MGSPVLGGINSRDCCIVVYLLQHKDLSERTSSVMINDFGSRGLPKADRPVGRITDHRTGDQQGRRGEPEAPRGPAYPFANLPTSHAASRVMRAPGPVAARPRPLQNDGTAPASHIYFNAHYVRVVNKTAPRAPAEMFPRGGKTSH